MHFLLNFEKEIIIKEVTIMLGVYFHSKYLHFTKYSKFTKEKLIYIHIYKEKLICPKGKVSRFTTILEDIDQHLCQKLKKISQKISYSSSESTSISLT